MTTGGTCLVADIGGTNSRFALATEDGLVDRRVFPTAEFNSINGLVEAYSAVTPCPARAALAVAGPVNGDDVVVTNRGWRCSRAALKSAFGFDELKVLNDFEAIAWSLPTLGPGDFVAIGPGRPVAGKPMVVMGPGTGLGVAAVVPTIDGITVVSGEGGHVTLAPIDDRQSEILEKLRREYGHVSAERVVSGSGLSNLYRVLGGSRVEPEEVTHRAASGDPVAVEALEQFFCWLGIVAGDLALTFGARGGVWLAGGILPKVHEALQRSRFRSAFEAKGRFQTYLSPVPTRLITAGAPALDGLGRLVKTDMFASMP